MMGYFIPAYILIWLLLMGYTLFLHQKQKRLERTLEFLKTLTQHADQAPPPDA